MGRMHVGKEEAAQAALHLLNAWEKDQQLFLTDSKIFKESAEERFSRTALRREAAWRVPR